MQAPSLRKDPFFEIVIKHLPTSQRISFEGWVTQISDDYTSNWSEQPVYGRMDPLVTFENTQRTIQLGFDIVSDDMAQAVDNLVKINSLIEFLYPMYEGSGRSLQNTLKAAPLLGLRWTNLINNTSDSGFLYGYIKGGLSYAPEIEQGGFILKGGSSSEFSVNSDISAVLPFGGFYEGESSSESDILAQYMIKSDNNSYIPKKVSLSFTFQVLHTHLTGWKKDKNFGPSLTNQFPNASLVDMNRDKTITQESSGDITSTDINISNFSANKALVLEGE